jgi:hypothetical protein
MLFDFILPFHFQLFLFIRLTTTFTIMSFASVRLSAIISVRALGFAENHEHADPASRTPFAGFAADTERGFQLENGCYDVADGKQGFEPFDCLYHIIFS